MISKYILPWFGGGSSVWTTAQLFFQVVLVGGYGYAYLLSRRDIQSQTKFHVLLAAVVLAWLAISGFLWGAPILPGSSLKPGAISFPVGLVLLVLLLSVGLPYFLLSTTSSLLQFWFSRMYLRESPYVFYVLSNTASLAALLSYPFLFEPNLTIRQQAALWTGGFILFAGTLAFTAYKVRQGAAQLGEPAEGTFRDDEIQPLDHAGEEQTGWKNALTLINIAACGTVLLLATTNQMTQDVASVPFLWVLPLSLYLLSFILGFTSLFEKRRGLLVLLMMIALFVAMVFLADPGALPVWLMILANSYVMFVGCLLCHSELYRRRPRSQNGLTSFYLMVAIGGAFGGILVGIAAPLLFSDFWEYPAALVICADLIVNIAFQERRGAIYKLRITIVAVTLVTAGYILLLRFVNYTAAIQVSRNFYGVQRVRLDQFRGIEAYSLVSGSIVHGIEAVNPEYRDYAPGYYSEKSGAALAINQHPKRLANQPLKIGILGLGTGTMAFFGQPGDTIRYYEIDPQVIRIAQDTRYFTYLRDTPASVEIIEGDGRLSLERELDEGQSQQFDVLVIDAFSGDSVPTHLISIEAVSLYLQHLKPDGLLVFNISNKYLNLEPVLWRAKESANLKGVYIEDTPGTALGFSSRWVVLSRGSEFFSQPLIASSSEELEGGTKTRLWTDEYSNLFQALR